MSSKNTYIGDIKKLKLTGGTYDLIVRDLSDANSSGYPWAYIDFEKREVHMHTSLDESPELTYQVLFHELIHEILMTKGVSSYLSENNIVIEETLCDAVGFGIAEVISKNPDLIKSIQTYNSISDRKLFEGRR